MKAVLTLMEVIQWTFLMINPSKGRSLIRSSGSCVTAIWSRHARLKNCTEAAPRKGVSLRSLKQYSVDFHWQRRCEAYDTQIAKEAAKALMEKRQHEIDGFIDQDFSIATRMQGLVDKKLEVLEKTEDVDVKELRTLTGAYKESRAWIQELLGLMEDARGASEEKA